MAQSIPLTLEPSLFSVQGHRPSEREDAFANAWKHLGKGKVRLTLPTTMSWAGFLYRVQAIAKEAYERDAIFPARLEKWATELEFTDKPRKDRVITIDGRVKGSAQKSRDEQVRFLKRRGLQMPALRDLVVAHAAYFLTAKADLFSGSVVRASDGALFFYSDGLDIDSSHDGYRFDNIAAAASLPGRSQVHVRPQSQRGVARPGCTRELPGSGQPRAGR